MYAPYGLPPEVGEILRAKDEEIRRLDKQIEMMATMRQEIYKLKREQSQLSAGSSRPSFFDHHRASTSFHGQLPPSGFISLPQWPDSEEALRRGDRDRKRSRSRERRTERRESRDRGRHRESRRTRSRSRDRETWKESRRSRSRSRDPRSTTVFSFLSRRSPESSRDRSPPRRPVLSPRKERSRDRDRDRKREESSKRTETVCSSSSSRRREEEKRRKEKRREDPKSSKASSEPKKSCNSTTSRQRGDDNMKEEIKSSSTHHSSSSKKLSTSTKPSSSSFTKASSSSSSSWRKEEDRRKEESTKSSFASSSKTTKHPSSSSSSRDWTKDSRESEKRKEKKAEEEPEIDLEMLEEVDDDYDYFDTVSEHEVLERIPTPDDGLSAYERMQRKLLAIPNDLDEYLTDEEEEAQDTIETFSESAPVEDSTTKIQIAQNLGKVEKKKATRQAAEIAKRLKSGQKLSKNQKRAIRVGSLQITVGGEPGRQVKVLGPETTDTKEKDTVRKNTVINKNPAAKTTIGEGPETESPVSTKYPAKKTTVPYPPADSSVVLGEVTETTTLSKRQQRRKRKEANIPTTVPKKMALPTVTKKYPLVIDLTSGHRVEKVTPAPTVSSVQAKSTVSSGLDSTLTSSGLVTRSIVSGSPEKTTTVSSSNSSGPETKSTVWRKETGLQPTVIPTLHRKPIPSLMDVPVQALWGSFPAPTSHFVSTSTYSNLIPSFCDSPHFSGTYFEPSPPIQAYSTPVPSYNHPYFSQPAPVPQPMAYSVPPPMQMPFPSYGQPVQETVNPPVPGMSTSSRADLARQAESFLKTIQNRDGLVESDLKKGIEEKKMISTQGTVDLTTHVTLDKSGAPVPRLTAQILGGSGGQLVQKRRKTEINSDEDEYDMIFN